MNYFADDTRLDLTITDWKGQGDCKLQGSKEINHAVYTKNQRIPTMNW